MVIPLSGPLSLLYFQANFVAIRDVCRLLLQSVEQQQHAEIRGQGPDRDLHCHGDTCDQQSDLDVDFEIQAHSINRLLGQKPVKRLLVSSDAAFIEEYPPLVQLDFAIRLNLHLLAGGSQESHLNQMPQLDTDRIELRPGVWDLTRPRHEISLESMKLCREILPC